MARCLFNTLARQGRPVVSFAAAGLAALCVLASSAEAGTYTGTVSLSPAAPASVTTGNPVHASVSFGRTFSSIDNVCFTTHFADVTGGEYEFGFPPVEAFGSFTAYQGGAIGQGLSPGQSSATICTGPDWYSSQAPLFLDGAQD